MRNLLLFLLLLITVQHVFADDTRLRCEKVISVSSTSKQWKGINNLITKRVTKYQALKIKIAQIRVLNNLNEWYIADVSFDKLDPAIFILKHTNNKFKVIEELSGDLREEGEPQQTIYKYFAEKVPNAPLELFYCSAPQIAKNW